MERDAAVAPDETVRKQRRGWTRRLAARSDVLDRRNEPIAAALQRLDVVRVVRELSWMWSNFMRGKTRVMSVSIGSGARLDAGKPRLILEVSDVARGSFSYDVAGDGQRFVMIQSTGWKPAPSQITIVQNWFEELKSRVTPGSALR